MFPILYHAHYSRHHEDIPFWLALAHEQGGPVLELGCGTGRILLPLAEAGLQVFGLDQDFDMLAVLHQHIPPPALGRVHVWQAQMHAFRAAARFRLILVPCNTYSTLSQAERQATARRAAQLLMPGGVFTFAVPNPSLLQKMPRTGEEEIEEVFPHPLDGAPVQVSSAWQRSSQFFTITWHYDHRTADGSMTRTQVETRHYLSTRANYLDELRQAGFQNFRFYGNFDRTEFKPRSDFLIVCAS